MATRQETIDSRLKDLAQFHKEHPEFDFETLAAPFKQRINFEFDVKETVGDDVWKKMASAITDTLHVNPEEAKNPQVALAEARSYLDGHKELQDRFDIVFKHINNESVAATRKIGAEVCADAAK